MTQVYMACLNVEGRRCLVIGDDEAARKETASLRACGAAVVQIPAARYRRRALRGALLVVAATSDRLLNERIHRDAERRPMLCHVADAPDLSNVVLPAAHRAGTIAVAVPTGNASPILATNLRERIAALMHPARVDLTDDLRALRPWGRRRFQRYE